MIALCRQHADQADNGAFTDDQLRNLKISRPSRRHDVHGRFNWMRRDLLAIVGGNFFYEQRVIFQINDTKCIWFDRDQDGYLLVSFKMPTGAGQPRAEIEQNFWKVPPTVDEIVCPPSGRLIQVTYSNGDLFKAEFFDIPSPDALASRYPRSNTQQWSGLLNFPVTAVELWETVSGTNIELAPTISRVGSNLIAGAFVRAASNAGIKMSVSDAELMMLFPQAEKTFIGQSINLTELIDMQLEPRRLEGFNFIKCQINGPTVLLPLGTNELRGCTFMHPIEAALYEVPEGANKTGLLPLIGCRFIDCQLSGVGFCGTREQLDVFRQISLK